VPGKRAFPLRLCLPAEVVDAKRHGCEFAARGIGSVCSANNKNAIRTDSGVIDSDMAWSKDWIVAALILRRDIRMPAFAQAGQLHSLVSIAVQDWNCGQLPQE
jgi:hypothetical protein